jgi:hypothetical protein
VAVPNERKWSIMKSDGRGRVVVLGHHHLVPDRPVAQERRLAGLVHLEHLDGGDDLPRLGQVVDGPRRAPLLVSQQQAEGDVQVAVGGGVALAVGGGELAAARHADGPAAQSGVYWLGNLRKKVYIPSKILRASGSWPAMIGVMTMP